MTYSSTKVGIWQALSSQGIHLFPLWEKRPSFRWGEPAKTAPDRLPEYLSENPPGMGIPTGPSGLIVVDIDAKKSDCSVTGFDAIGASTLFDMIDMEEPPVVQTPTGGQHVYFKAPEGSTVKSSASKWREQVDIRALGGMVVAPGSDLPNGLYRPLYGSFEDIPTIPQWLYDELKEEPQEPRKAPMPLAPGGTKGDALVETITRELAYMPAGKRNPELHRRTLVLIERGLLDNYSTSLLVAAAEYAGLGRAEIEMTIKSAMKKKGLI